MRAFPKRIKSEKRKIVRLLRELQAAFSSDSIEASERVLENILKVNASLKIMEKHWLSKCRNRVKKGSTR